MNEILEENAISFNVEERAEGLIEIEVSARILDLIQSFVDSSTKLTYDHNKPPYIKILTDGCYWQYKVKKCKGLDIDCECVEFVTWKNSLTICLLLENIIIFWDQIYEFNTSPKTLLNTVFTSYKRQRKIKLFDVYRKLLFYENLENYYYRRGELEEQQQQNS